MYARVRSIRFAEHMRAAVVSVGQGLVPILQRQQGFKGVHMLMDPNEAEGTIITLWETEADSEAGEADPSYINQMSMMSSFLSKPLAPKTYEVKVQT